MTIRTIGENAGNTHSGFVDTNLYANFPNSNGVSDEHLQLFIDATGVQFGEALLRADINAAIPVGATINEARLLIWVESGYSNPTMSLYRLLRDVVYAEATWNIFSIAGGNWGTAGAQSAGVDYDATPLATLSVGTSETVINEGVTWDVWTGPALTQNVQDIRNGTVQNYGWLLKITTASGPDSFSYYFHTSNAIGANVGKRPYLYVDYTTSSGAQAIAWIRV